MTNELYIQNKEKEAVQYTEQLIKERQDPNNFQAEGL
jgi:hypothetical protein